MIDLREWPYSGVAKEIATWPEWKKLAARQILENSPISAFLAPFPVPVSSTQMIDCPRCGQQIEYIKQAENYLCARCGVLWRFLKSSDDEAESK